MLLVTWMVPSTKLHQVISEQLKIAVSQLPAESSKWLSVHLLHLPDNAELSPNAYLNLARFFSQTDLVILFPMSVLKLPPLLSHQDLLTQYLASPNAVSIVSNEADANFPFHSLTPVVLPQNHTVWCTERVFISDSREVHWATCLWQIWLDTFGDLTLLQVPEWDHPKVLSIPANTTKVRLQKYSHAAWELKSQKNILLQRLSNNYRNETCVLARKRLATLIFNKKTTNSTMVAKTEWLKHVCRQVHNFHHPSYIKC